MDTANIESLTRKSAAKIAGVPTGFKRYLHDQVHWTDRLIIIKGARGVGKTTMLLQHIKEIYGATEAVLYVSLDDIWFSENKLVDLADHFVNLGGKALFLDEVHKYPNWSQEVKNIYDDHPDLKLVLTSSSALHIFSGKADLSRRAMVYELNELSLREFIVLRENINLSAVRLNDILDNHLEASLEITRKIKPIKALKAYYSLGSYPYFLENPDNYQIRLQNSINTTLETDLPAILNIDYNSVIKLKKLLYVIATSVPFKPNIAKLSEKTGIARDTLLRYLHHLSEAHLIHLLHSEQQGISYLTKPDKLFLYNCNLLEAITGNKADPGTLRETFFLNQLSATNNVTMPAKGDFLVDGHYLFEVGGKSKTGRQIKNQANAYIAADDIEVGHHHKIPLWLFGMLY